MAKWYTSAVKVSPKQKRSVRDKILKPVCKNGIVAIILTGRYAGKRVIVVKNLPFNNIIVTGPTNINGVPLSIYPRSQLIFTNTNALSDKSNSQIEKITASLTSKSMKLDKKSKKTNKDEFFAQGNDKKEDRVKEAVKNSQSNINDVINNAIKNDKVMLKYLKSLFSLNNSDRPHLMNF